MKALIIVGTRVEDIELSYPLYRLREEGLDVDIATPEEKTMTGKHGYEFEADLALRDVNVGSYSALVIPGGRSPEKLRPHLEAVEIVESAFQEGLIVAAICHGAQLLISADVIEDKQLTCYPAIAVDVENAGGVYVDESVVVDGRLVTSRVPDDLPDFMGETITKLNRVRVKD